MHYQRVAMQSMAKKMNAQNPIAGGTTQIILMTEAIKR